MDLIDNTPTIFKDKDLSKLKEFDIKDKIKIFSTLKYPSSTWFYHKIIGIGKEHKLNHKDKIDFFKHLCEQDLYYLAKYILGKDKLRERPNRQMCERIMIRETPREQERKLICEPRFTYKSTIASLCFPIWLLINNPELSILIDSETDNQAADIYSSCKDMMENNILLIEIWGEFRSDRKWNEKHLIVNGRKSSRRDPSLFHSGADSSINGGHPDVIILDDPHSEQNTQYESQIDKVDQHYRILTPLLDKQGLLILITTRWTHDDLTGRILKREQYEWSSVSVKSCWDKYEDGKLYGEEIGLTKKYLENAKKFMGIYQFSANFENDPKPDVDKSFKLAWLQFYKDEDLFKTENGIKKELPLSKFISIDASWADKNSTGKDPTAIIVGGFTRDGKLYVLEIFNERVNPTAVIDKVFELIKKWQPLAVASEDVNTQKGINRDIEIQMQARNVWFKFDKVKHQAISKENRIMSLTPFFQNGNFYIREIETDFLDQYTLFNPSHKISHDDILDALEMMVSQYRDFYFESGVPEEQFLEDEYTVYDEVTGRC